MGYVCPPAVKIGSVSKSLGRKTDPLLPSPAFTGLGCEPAAAEPELGRLTGADSGWGLLLQVEILPLEVSGSTAGDCKDGDP